MPRLEGVMNRWLFLWRKWTRQLWVKATAYAGVGVAAALLAAALAPGCPTTWPNGWAASRSNPS